ncbi:MAG: protein CrcB [Hyphomicrobiales bacterium]|nr:protein CrcB [Hyphomicrobiales bacterium]
MQALLLVFLGAGLGGSLRHGVNLVALRHTSGAFPYGTLFINVAGSFVMGALAAWLSVKAGQGVTQPLRLFLMTGVLGGFTTFSAFSLETISMWERGEAAGAVAYVAASIVLSLIGLVAGMALVRSLG